MKTDTDDNILSVGDISNLHIRSDNLEDEETSF